MEEFGIIKYVSICVAWLFALIFVVEMPFNKNKKDVDNG